MKYRIIPATVLLFLSLSSGSVLCQRSGVRLPQQPSARVMTAGKLGTIVSTQALALRSMCSQDNRMYGAAAGKIVLIGENGQITKTLPSSVQNPIISGFAQDTLLLADASNKNLFKYDLKNGTSSLLLNLNKVQDGQRGRVPNASFLHDSPLSSIAYDGSNVYAATSAGFSSSIFKIDPRSGKIVGSGFAAGPEPTAMAFSKGKLMALDGRAGEIRSYDAGLKASRDFVKVSQNDAKGIAVINDEVRVLSRTNNGITRFSLSAVTGLRSNVTMAPAIPLIIGTMTAINFPQKYAVLICGDIAENFWGECFWNDTVWMYKTLLNTGYKPENIYVLYGNGSDYASANPAYQHGSRVTDFAATVTWVNKVFDGLKDGDSANGIGKMDDNDTLFVWTFDHGGGGNDAYLCLWGGSITDTAFAAKLNAVAYQKRAIFMQQCRSGGFIDNLANNKTMISTACRADQNAQPADTENEAYGGKAYSHGEYNYYVISALRKLTPTGSAVNADQNANAKISARECHNWETGHESRSEVPQISDAASIGLNFHIVD